MHSNIVSSVSVSVSVNKPVLYLPASFLPPDGCPDLCNGNGRCTLGQNSWQCVCQTGWRGPGCNVAMETSCADNKDNEGGEQKSSNSPSLKSRGLSTLSSWVILLQKEFGCHYHQVLLFPSFRNKRGWALRPCKAQFCQRPTAAHGVSWVLSTARWAGTFSCRLLAHVHCRTAYHACVCKHSSWFSRIVRNVLFSSVLEARVMLSCAQPV